ncbi:MAG: hypothetical protein RIB03_12565 [Henriciella sp.]|uniref:hypothetical protein n=1 Tax=Henriciella sp. TaxID=1968823 RepID=UPI0032EFBB41
MQFPSPNAISGFGCAASLASAIIAFQPAPAAAQDLSPRYDRLGTLDGKLEGDTLTLMALYDKKYDRSGLSVMSIAGQPSFAIIARNIDDAGEVTRPTLSLSIGPVEPGKPDYEITEARLMDDQGRRKPLRATADEGTATLEQLVIGPDGKVSFALTLELKRHERVSGKFIAVNGAKSVTLTGQFEGEVRAKDRGQLE